GAVVGVDLAVVEVDAVGPPVGDVARHGGLPEVQVAVALDRDVALDGEVLAHEVRAGGDPDVALDGDVLQRAGLARLHHEVAGHGHTGGVDVAAGRECGVRGPDDSEAGERQSPDEDAGQ